MQEISLESLATGLLTELTRTFSPDGLHTISSGVVEGLIKGLADPTVKEAIASTFCPTGLGVARDARQQRELLALHFWLVRFALALLFCFHQALIAMRHIAAPKQLTVALHKPSTSRRSLKLWSKSDCQEWRSLCQ